jgi:hypothetical protein
MKPQNRLIGLAVGVIAITGIFVIAQVRHTTTKSGAARLDTTTQAASGNPVMMTAVAAQPVAAQADSHTLRVLTSLDSDFNSTLDREYPELRRLPEFQDWQSKIVIVQNQSSWQVHGFVMKWTTQSPGETPSVSYTPFMKTAKPDHVLTGGVVLAPKETLLLSPWVTLTKSQFAGMKGGGPQSALGAFLRANGSGPARDSKLLGGSVDSAVFSDSTIVGPDEAKLLDHFECERNGQHDEGVSIGRALRANASDQQIIDKLNEHIQTGQVLRGNNDRESLYRVARASQAQMLLQIFKQGGRGKLEQSVGNMLRFKPTRLKRV